MLGRFLDSTYCTTLHTCSIRRGLCPPTRHSRLEFLQYSRLVFVLPATCTTADYLVVLVVAHIIDGRFNDTTDPLDPDIEGSRQTHSEQSCLEPFCTPHIFVAFLFFFDGRRPVGCATGHHSLFMLCATSNIVPVTVLPFANFLSSAIPKMFPSVCRVFMPYFSVVRCD